MDLQSVSNLSHPNTAIQYRTAPSLEQKAVDLTSLSDDFDVTLHPACEIPAHAKSSSYEKKELKLERLGILLLPIFLLVGLAQIYLGYIGVEHHLGFWAAIAAVGAMFVFRFMLPITIGSYFGAVDVLGWPWWGGVLVAAPGLLFIAPTMIMAALEPLFSKR